MSDSIRECYTIPFIEYSLSNEIEICEQKIEYAFSCSGNNYANK